MSRTSLARVVILAGPSGSGKSRLTRRLQQRYGWTWVNLDDFYRDADDPALPWTTLPGGESIVDWDDPRSWNGAAALAALTELCRGGSASIPRYDISISRAVGTVEVSQGDSPVVIAEGIFAPELVTQCRQEGLLAEAVCLAPAGAVTMVRRLIRDVREHRKPIPVLLRRGWQLARRHRTIIDAALEAGCRPMPPRRAEALLDQLASSLPATPHSPA